MKRLLFLACASLIAGMMFAGCETDVTVNTPPSSSQPTNSAPSNQVTPSQPNVPPVMPTAPPTSPVVNNSGITVTVGTITTTAASSPREIALLTFDNASNVNLNSFGGTFITSNTSKTGTIQLIVDGTAVGGDFPLSALANNRFEFGNLNLLLTSGKHEVKLVLTSNHGVGDTVQIKVDKIFTNLGLDNTTYDNLSILCG